MKSLTYTINTQPTIPAYPRYFRFIGYGDNVSAATTRLVELQVMYGATNLLLNKLPISGEAVSTGGTIDKVTDGDTTMAGYPIWWNGAGIPTLTYDLGDYTIYFSATEPLGGPEESHTYPLRNLTFQEYSVTNW